MAEYLHDQIPGVKIPPEIRKRFEAAREDDYEELGVEIALGIMERIRSKRGINGLHLMAVGWESMVPRLIREAGLN